MRILLWPVYKIAEDNFLSQTFPEFIQIKKKYPNYLNKISILT